MLTETCSDFEVVGLDPNVALYVTNLSVLFDDELLHSTFSREDGHSVKRCYIKKNVGKIPSVCYAFVEYHTIAAAADVKEHFESAAAEPVHGRKLSVKWGSPRRARVQKTTVEVFFSFKRSELTQNVLYEKTITALVVSLLPGATPVDVAIKNYNLHRHQNGITYNGHGLVLFPRTVDGVRMACDLFSRFPILTVEGVMYNFKIANKTFPFVLDTHPVLREAANRVLTQQHSQVELPFVAPLPFVSADEVHFDDDQQYAPSPTNQMSNGATSSAQSNRSSPLPSPRGTLINIQSHSPVPFGGPTTMPTSLPYSPQQQHPQTHPQYVPINAYPTQQQQQQAGVVQGPPALHGYYPQVPSLHVPQGNTAYSGHMQQPYYQPQPQPQSQPQQQQQQQQQQQYSNGPPTCTPQHITTPIYPLAVSPALHQQQYQLSPPQYQLYQQTRPQHVHSPPPYPPQLNVMIPAYPPAVPLHHYQNQLMGGGGYYIQHPQSLSPPHPQPQPQQYSPYQTFSYQPQHRHALPSPANHGSSGSHSCRRYYTPTPSNGGSDKNRSEQDQTRNKLTKAATVLADLKAATAAMAVLAVKDVTADSPHVEQERTEPTQKRESPVARDRESENGTETDSVKPGNTAAAAANTNNSVVVPPAADDGDNADEGAKSASPSAAAK